MACFDHVSNTLMTTTLANALMPTAPNFLRLDVQSRYSLFIKTKLYMGNLQVLDDYSSKSFRVLALAKQVLKGLHRNALMLMNPKIFLSMIYHT